MKRMLILSALALTMACGKHEAPEGPGLPKTSVRLAKASTAGEIGWIAATLTSTQRAVLSTRMAASVRKVHVNEGQHVAAGALLVSLSDDDLQGGLQAAEAGVAAASAHHQRIVNLSKQGASTPSELEMAQTQLAQAQAALAQVRGNIAYTQIRAPFAGVVQARRVNDGDFVGPGMPLVELEGQGAMELVGSVSESEAKGLKIGQRLVFEAEGQTGTAQITGLSTGGDPISHRGTIRAAIQKGVNLRTGSFARLKLTGVVEKTTELFVPQSALVVRGELRGVFVAKNGKAELRWLSLGESQGDQLPVRAGLTSGEVVIDQPGELKDGQPIEVLR